MIDQLDNPQALHPDPQQLAQHYDDLRLQLAALKRAPQPDRAAIDLVVHLLDQTHAAFKAAHGVAAAPQR